MAAAAEISQRPSVVPAAYKPIIQSSTSRPPSLDNASFDPQKHLSFEPPKSTYMMTDLGYKSDTGVSPVAASQPFRLFSPEAIQRFREEALHPDVMNSHTYSGSLGACMLRGYAAKSAPFIYDAWHNPETLSIVSEIAGVDLVPCMNFEIGHINISVKSEAQAAAERAAVAQENSADATWEDTSPVVGWHHDSYPFVCVTMLSDCTDMIGGETALRTANGEVMKVRGPEMGCAVVLQGRYITHQALRALGARERITMVTSFRPKSPHLADDSVLDTVRGISDLSELYYEFGRYRLEVLEERIRSQLQNLRQHYTAGKKLDTRALKTFLEESEQFLRHTNTEMVQNEDVIPGVQPTLDIPDAPTESSERRKKPTISARL